MLWNKFATRTLVLLFSLVIIFQHSWAARKLTLRAFYTRAECKVLDSELVPIFSCGLEGSGKANLSFSGRIVFSRDINNLTLHWRVAMKRNERWETYISTDLDLCLALSQLHNNFLLRMITEQLRHYSNLPLLCPLKKGVVYFVKNFTIDSGALPPYIPELEWAALGDYDVDGRKFVIANTFGKLERVATKKRKLKT